MALRAAECRGQESLASNLRATRFAISLVAKRQIAAFANTVCMLRTPRRTLRAAILCIEIRSTHFDASADAMMLTVRSPFAQVIV